jgi:hypothetical protein
MHHDLVSFFALEHFRGAESVLLTTPGAALPTVALSEGKDPVQFVDEIGERIFGVKATNLRKIGTTRIDNYVVHVVTGDCLCPANIHHNPDSHLRFQWVPTYELFNDRSPQTYVLALARSRIAGWHIEPMEDGDYRLSFKMEDAHKTLGEAIKEATGDKQGG